MNKKLTTIWGVSLVVVLLVSLLVAAVPASAKNLDFTPETLPSATDLILNAGGNIVDMSVAADGQTIYVADGTANVKKSTNAGASWSNKATGFVPAMAVDLVAVAPDDPNLVVIADSTTGAVAVTTDGGTTWGALTAVAAGANDLACSSAYAGDNYVAIALGTGAAGSGDIGLYKLGIGGAWTMIEGSAGITAAATLTDILAVEFSPNFSSDQTLLAVTDDATNTRLEAYSVNLNTWNTFANYPVALVDSTAAAVTGATSGSLAIAPTYLGGDEVERVCFIGINGGGANDAGVYRIEDYTVKHIKTGINIYSVAYDGNVLVAGTTAVRIWRSNDALASSPTFYVSAATKSPGGTTNVILAYAGANLVAGTAGNESAFAVSTDNGMSFNDISLINTALTVIDDFAMAADGSVKYFASDDTVDLSVWSKAGYGPWQRILSAKTATTASYLVRIAKDDPSTIYVGTQAVAPAADARTLYVSKDGGQTRWYTRTSRYAIQDIAVESEDVAYVGVGAASNTVSKTVNAGFTWADAESAKLKAGNVYSIKSIAEDQVVVGSTTGAVSYTTDGGDSWYKIPQSVRTGFIPGVTNVHVTADTLGEGGSIWAGAENSPLVTRWNIGQPDVPWFDTLATDYSGVVLGATYGTFGIEYYNGTLYVNSVDYGVANEGHVLRTMMPKVEVANNALYWGDWGVGATTAPVGAQVGNLLVTDGAFKGMQGNTVYAATGGLIRSCIDTMVTAGPTINGPVDGKEVRLNPISGGISNVSLSWTRLSEATSYTVQVAYDEDFDERLVLAGGGVVATTGATPAFNVGGGLLDLGTTYYWRVHADQANGVDTIISPWSEARTFTVESGGTVSAEILSPENGGYVSQTSPSFSWAPISGATRYEFQLSADTSFAAPLASTQHAAAGANPDVTLEVGNTYYWRVRAIEPGMGEWSTIANFTVAESVPGEATSPEVTVTIPEITIPPIEVPQATVNLPEGTGASTSPISEGLLWAVIIIGAVLVIALIILIVRTRRTV